MVEIACISCGALFAPKRMGHVHCSALCLGRSKRARNKDHHNALAKEYMRRARKNYPERVRANNARYRQKPENRKQAAEASRTWHSENSTRANEGRIVRKQNQRIQRPWHILVNAAKHRAKNKKLLFDLTTAWAESRWTGQCELTKIPFVIGQRGAIGNIFAPSIDKIDRTKGYVQNNCRFVLHCINTFKYTGTDDTMYAVAEALLANRTMLSLHGEESKAALSLPT